jgi:cell division protein FtsZ
VIATGFSGEEPSKTQKKEAKTAPQTKNPAPISQKPKSEKKSQEESKGLDIPEFLQRRRRR